MKCNYDTLDRVSKIYYNNTVACTYSYNGEGYMSEVVDYKSHIKVKYEYDSHGRNTVTTYFTFSGTNPRYGNQATRNIFCITFTMKTVRRLA